MHHLDDRDFDAARNPEDFEELVSWALDGLPDFVLKELENVAVVVSDDGARQHLYGQYRGIHAENHNRLLVLPAAPDRITIFRDTLVRDFGHDQALLRDQVRDTVRHEVGHHLGLDEDAVRRLGL